MMEGGVKEKAYEGEHNIHLYGCTTRLMNVNSLFAPIYYFLLFSAAVQFFSFPLFFQIYAHTHTKPGAFLFSVGMPIAMSTLSSWINKPHIHVMYMYVWIVCIGENRLRTE